MKPILLRGRFLLAVVALAGTLLAGLPGRGWSAETFITIGGGNFTGVYFPTGRAIARIINRNRAEHGLRATVEATAGSPFNLGAVVAGYREFGLAQADDQYAAVNGLDAWAGKGPQQSLRAVLSLYPETLALVAAIDAGIRTLADLKGKRVSLGNPGAFVDTIVAAMLEAAGIDPVADLVRRDVNPSEAPALLQDGHLDAYFFPVGHPNASIREALAGPRKAHLVPLAGPAVDRLVADNPFYSPARLRAGELYPGLIEADAVVDSFGVRATLCTSDAVPEDTVYRVTKLIFENLEELKRQHPALAGLKREEMLDGLTAPLHPGALRYYREIGLPLGAAKGGL
jgi:hypothetical protein